MSVSEIKTNTNHWLPKEVSTGAIGITITASANVAIQFFASLSEKQAPALVRNFVGFSCAAAAIAGTVITIYSAVHLCQKIMADKPPKKAVLMTAIGGFSTALAQTINQHFWEIAPSFKQRWMYSMSHLIATNFAWQLSAITGLAGLVFTAYAAYRTGQAIYKSSIAQ